jgi:Na+-transporting NADH:ubiquinone oxidoreductase subunit C
MQRDSTAYTVGFAAVVCLVAGICVSTLAVGLKDKQDANKKADKQKKVLIVAGLMGDKDKLDNDEVQALFDSGITPRVVEMSSGRYADGAVDPATYDARAAAKDASLSFAVEANAAKVSRLPNHAVVYEIKDEAGNLQQVILPIHGPGLWSTLYGFLALEPDGNTVRGITFYEHAETPGLGGEVDNAKWKAGWEGRKVYDASGDVALGVVKGKAGDAASAPHDIDGLSGATLTSNGVTSTIEFWLGDQGFKPFLDQNLGS